MRLKSSVYYGDIYLFYGITLIVAEKSNEHCGFRRTLKCSVDLLNSSKPVK